MSKTGNSGLRYLNLVKELCIQESQLLSHLMTVEIMEGPRPRRHKRKPDNAFDPGLWVDV